ncbi:MAG TPA: phosphopantetheine-binding protein [Candidatus Limnocylindria bacterium]|nr:phosphopantetheine-binding protein [Candidatus Limnocylindria bacterium]
MNDKKKLLDRFTSLVAEILKVPVAEIDPAVQIQDLGFMSTQLIQLSDKLTEELGEEVHPGVFFEYPSIETFTGYLLAEKPELASTYLTRLARTMVHAEVPVTTAVTSHTRMGNGNGNGHGKGNGSDPWSGVDPSFFDVNSRVEASAAPMPKGTDEIPVIVGGGIGAMLISRTLTEKKIRHMVIGKSMVDDTPKLGESMTESVSIEFTRHYKQYSQYFFKKEVTPFFMGKIVSGLRFGFFKTFASIFLEGELPEGFIHIDRIGFDAALYEEVKQSKYCEWVDTLVKDVDYCEKSDRVRGLTLADGKVVTPSFVWDCTNHIRLLGRKLKIPYKDFDAPRKVIFTHYFNKNPNERVPCDVAPWIHATSLLNADPETDAMTGVSWLIPLGSYVSVGISIADTDMGTDTPEEIITKLTRAYQRRGLDYTKYFPRRKEVVVVPSQHFMYERFVGKNWALVGGSAASTWFTSGSQISMLCCMSCMADLILQQPEVYGEHYSRHVSGFAGTQEVYDSLLDSKMGPIDAMKFLSRIVEQGRKRISSFFMFRAGIGTDTAKTASDLWHEKVTVDKAYFDFLRQLATHAIPEDRSQQTAAIFAKFEELKKRDTKVTIPYLRNHPVRSMKPELFLKEDM